MSGNSGIHFQYSEIVAPRPDDCISAAIALASFNARSCLRMICEMTGAELTKSAFGEAVVAKIGRHRRLLDPKRTKLDFENGSRSAV